MVLIKIGISLQENFMKEKLETNFIEVYVKLIEWAIENEFNLDDVEMACKVFLMQRGEKWKV